MVRVFLSRRAGGASGEPGFPAKSYRDEYNLKNILHF